MDIIVKKIKELITNKNSDVNDLLFQNEFGGFDLLNNEYIIRHGSSLITPRPWTNVIANKNFGTIVSESALGATWFDNSKDKRISSWSNDSVRDIPSEAVYIKDNVTKKFWTPTRLPVGSLQDTDTNTYMTRHGNGYTVFESSTNGISQGMLVFVDKTEQLKYISLTLQNTTNQPRNLSLYYYVDLVMGNYKNQFGSFVRYKFKDEFNSIVIKRSDKHEFNKRVFLSSNLKISSWTNNKNDFIGYSGSLKNPLGLEQDQLPEPGTYPRENCCVIKVDIELLPNEVKSAQFFLGAATHEENIKELLTTHNSDESIEAALASVQSFWNETNSKVVIKTPDPQMDIIFNNWTLYQTLSCRIWGRSSFYQSSGAYGYRDQLQDTMPFVYIDRNICREHILKAASRQFEEGDVQHWWFEDSGLGVRNKVADSPLWLAHVASYYVEKTGDYNILDEQIAYLKGKGLSSSVNAYVEVPATSELRESLWQHCLKAIDHVSDFGIHGIPLIKEGDWNDGMNLVGEKGMGESIWLGWFLGSVLESFIQLARKRNDVEVENRFQNLYENLRASMKNSAWGGEWYLRAYTDDGHRLGSTSSIDCKIDSISQSWAVLSGMDDEEHQTQAINSALKYLVDSEHKLSKLLYPAFDKGEFNPGYIKDYVPGIRENGGQYSHAAFWLVMALAKRKESELALEILSYTNPIKHSETKEALYQYELEPYVIGGDIYSSDQHMGKGGWSWYTASSGLSYRTVLESILGFKLFGDTIQFTPCVPKSWKEFSVNYKQGNSLYDIKFHLADNHSNTVMNIILDGKSHNTNQIPFIDDQKDHKVLVNII